MTKHNTSPISYAIFIFSLVIVSINLASVFFPSLIITLVDDSVIDAKPFELGTWAFPVLGANITILIFGILYITKRLPSFVQNSINFIKNFEISRNVASIVMVGIVFGSIGFAIEELPVDEGKTFGDFERVKLTVENWPFETRVGDELISNLHVKNFLLKSSQFLFQNYRVMPLIVSISLLLLTYFFTAELTKKRFAGIIATIILLQSNTFQAFDTIATYENSWVLFYLLSLYLIIKKWFLSPISYVASIFSKPLTAAYYPMTIFFLCLIDIPRRKKFYLLLSYGIIAIAAIIVFVGFGVNPDVGITAENLTFDYRQFWSGFTIWSFQLRYDSLFLLFILPLIVALFLTSRNGLPQADAVLILIVGAIIAMPLLVAMTGYNVHPYRYVALLNFFAIGVGILLSKSSLDGSKNGTG